jgi:transposase
MADEKATAPATGRRALVDEEQTPEAAARAAGVCPKTACKWVNRFKAEGRAGLMDRSSRPKRLYRPTPDEIVRQIEQLRRQRRAGQQIAVEVGVSPATVSRVLKRLGLNRIAALEPAEPIRRYEREKPGDLIHIDIKKLGRFNQTGHRITGDRTRQSSRRGIRQGKAWGAGWEFVHVAIDDNSRIAFAKVMPNEKKRSATAFLRAAVALLRKSRRQDPTRDERQRCLLQILRVPQSLQTARIAAHQNPAIYPKDQWQSRALHSDYLAGMGLCAGLSKLKPAPLVPARLVAFLQLAQASCRHR